MLVTIILLFILFLTTLLYGRFPDSIYFFYAAAVVFSMVSLHGLLSMSLYLKIYIVPLYAIFLLAAPVLAIKIIYPFLISPRRFYANVFQLAKDPWVPPGYVSSVSLSHLCLVAYLFILSYVTLKLISLRKCGVTKEDVLIKYSIKMTVLSYCTFIIFHFSTSLQSMMDIAVQWIPFKDDMISALPMCIISTIVLLLRYEPLMINEICPQSDTLSSLSASSFLSSFSQRIV